VINIAQADHEKVKLRSRKAKVTKES